MKFTPNCGANGFQGLMFCYSRAADTVGITGLAMPELHKARESRVCSPAGVAGDPKRIVLISQAAHRMLAADPCGSDCAKRIMQKSGFNDLVHFRMTDFGWQKGKTPITVDRVAEVAAIPGTILQEALARATS